MSQKNRNTTFALHVYAKRHRHEKSRSFKKLRGSYKGKRCFIICNGPSLRADDLTKIYEHGDLSIGMNAIARIYDQTLWRPKFLFAADGVVFNKKNKELVKKCECGYKLYDRTRFLKSLGSKEKRLYLSFDESLELLDNPQFSDDATNKLPSIGTSTYAVIEFAVFLGCSEIYILGCDMSYAVNINRDGMITYNDSGKDYFASKEEYSTSSKVKPTPTWQMEVAYDYAAQYAREHGLKIYNATRGGKLGMNSRAPMLLSQLCVGGIYIILDIVCIVWQKGMLIMKIKSIIRSKLNNTRLFLNQQYYNWHKREYNIEEFKDMYLDQSCFIVGNGSSLLPMDLDLIQKNGFVTFAANKIYDIFKSTSWRPTYISVSDPRFIWDKKILHNIEQLQAKMFFVSSQFAWDVRKLNCNVCSINCNASRKLLDDPMFSMELENIIYDIATVTYFSLQIATYMGFKNIYLIGMDNRYAFSKLRDGTVSHNEGIMSYFKEGDTQVSNESTAAAVWEMDAAYEYADKYSREHGFRIYNATRGGFLEKFERVSLDELLTSEINE